MIRVQLVKTASEDPAKELLARVRESEWRKRQLLSLCTPVDVPAVVMELAGELEAERRTYTRLLGTCVR